MNLVIYLDYIFDRKQYYYLKFHIYIYLQVKLELIKKELKYIY